MSTNIKKMEAVIDDFIHEIQPLDLILFKGSSTLAKLIAFCTEHKLDTPSDNTYSHAGIVISREIINDPALEYGKLYIFESVLSGIHKSHARSIHHPNRIVFGVQVRELKSVILDYLKESTTIVTHASLNTYFRRRIDNTNNYTSVYYDLLDRMYDPNPCSLCAALFKILRPLRTITQEITHTEGLLFCSEMVATFLKNTSILPNINPSNVIPEDYIGYDTDNDIPKDMYIRKTKLTSKSFL